MLAPLSGWVDREVYGVFKVNAAMAAGLCVQIDNTNTLPATNTSPYASVFGDVVAASITTTGDMELGYLLQPVSTSGPTLLNILSQVYDESIAAGQTAAIVPPKQGSIIATDQFLASGTGHIAFDGTVAPGALCGIHTGQPRLVQSGDIVRLKFLGKVTQRALTLAAFQIV